MSSPRGACARAKSSSRPRPCAAVPCLVVSPPVWLYFVPSNKRKLDETVRLLNAPQFPAHRILACSRVSHFISVVMKDTEECRKTRRKVEGAGVSLNPRCSLQLLFGCWDITPCLWDTDDCLKSPQIYRRLCINLLPISQLISIIIGLLLKDIFIFI